MGSSSNADAGFTEAYRTHEPFLRARARRVHYKMHGLELQDVIQAGAIGLLRAERRFDAARSVGLKTYARRFVDEEIRRALRDSPPLEHTDDVVAPQGVMLSERSRRRPAPSSPLTRAIALDVEGAVRCLGRKERLVVSLVDVCGCTQIEVAQMLGVTHQAVQQTRKKALASLRAILMSDAA